MAPRKNAPPCGLPGRLVHTGDGRDPFALNVPDGGLIRQVVRRWGREWDAEDAFQECCIARLQALKTFNPVKGKWSTWLYWHCKNRLARPYQLAARRAVADRRRGRPTPGCADDADLDLLSSPWADDDGPDADSLLALGHALARLRPRLRAVVVARFYRGETLKEIGGRLGVSRERVRQMGEEGLAALRRTLGAAPVERKGRGRARMLILERAARPLPTVAVGHARRRESQHLGAGVQRSADQAIDSRKVAHNQTE